MKSRYYKNVVLAANVIIFILMFPGSSVFSETQIEPGTVSGEWTVDGSPYIVHGDIAVENGETLIIKPGVEVKFAAWAEISVYSGESLIAEGTKDAMIVFTSNEVNPSPGDWSGIILDEAEKASLRYCIVEYATNGISGYGYASGCSGGTVRPEVISCIIRNNSRSGIYCKGHGNTLVGCTSPYTGSCKPTIQLNLISDNGRHGIELYANGGFATRGYVYAKICGNVIVSNAINGIACYGNDDVKSDIIGNNIIENGGSGISFVEDFSGNSLIINNIIAQNDVGINSTAGVIPDYQFNNVWNNGVNYEGLPPADTDISSDPLFADADNGNYHLLDPSPCIGAGTPDASMLHIDIDGNPRPNPFDCPNPDIGAYESNRCEPLRTSGPDIAVNPSSWDYGNAVIGNYSSKTFTVSNPGGEALEVTAIEITGSDAGDFSIQGDDDGFSLNPGEIHHIAVRFTPSSVGSKTAVLSLVNNVADRNPLDIPLQGEGKITTNFHVATTGSDITGDGSAAKPYRTIQKGIDEAADGGTMLVVLVADGIYKGAGNVELDFKGKAITVKSENGAENCIIDCENISGTRGFYFHNGETSDSVVEGFTIRNGYSPSGGGITCYSSSPTITNNIITKNSASYGRGGGIYCGYSSSPTINNNTITENSALYNDGGGIYCGNSSSPTINNNTVTGNSARIGGGIHCNKSSPAIVNNTIIGNSAEWNGGGIYCNYDSSPAIANNTITGNSARTGGGIYCKQNSFPTIANNAIAGNSAELSGGGIYCHESSPTITNTTVTENSAELSGGGIYCYESSAPAMTNTILWDNSPQEIYFSADGFPNTVTSSYSDVEGGQAEIATNDNGTIDWREGNIDVDPLFVDATNGNYHLSDLSPCISAGTSNGAPSTDIEGNPRPDPHGSNPDMGAYESSFVAVVDYALRMHLLEDWNLISIPIELADTALATVFETIDSLYTAVWAYSANPGWERYIVGGPDFLNTLTDVVPGKGYWVEMSVDAELSLDGPPIEDPISLMVDWNLVGFNSVAEMDRADALASIAGYCNAAWGYDPASGWEKYVEGGPDFLNNLVSFKPGRGYWIDARPGCPPWDANGGALAAPPSPYLIAGTRQEHISIVKPKLPYTVWGSVEADGVKLTDDATIFLEVDGKTQGSYRLGSRAGNGDFYVLDIPPNGGSSESRLCIKMDDKVVETASLPSGNPGQIIHLDLSVKSAPSVSMVHQSYPNPFNPDTWIPYQLGEEARVEIHIYTLAGQLARTLSLGRRAAGFYIDRSKAAYWDGKNEAGEKVSSGVYFYTIQAGEYTDTRKMIMAR